jgi:RHS repeat-associated protein
MLTEVARPDGTTVALAYDALGRRVSKKVGDVETRWIWDGHVPVHELRTGAAEVTWYYEPESFAPLARFTDDSRLAVVSDHLGTPTALFNESGKVACEMRLDVYGEPRTGDQHDDLYPHRWPGQYADQQVGLFYNGFRYYDSALGQYISCDPIGLAGGLSPYAYVPDPLSWIDPLGLSQCPPKAGVVNTTPSPALRGSPYHPDSVAARVRPPYRVNLAHDRHSPFFNVQKTPEPADAPSTYLRAARADMGTWYGPGQRGWYRFSSDNVDRVHFSGTIENAHVPVDIRRRFGGV